MKKFQFPIFAEWTTADTEENVTRKLADTESPGNFRAIYSTIIRSRKRDEIDRITGTPATAAPANTFIMAALLALIFWRRVC